MFDKRHDNVLRDIEEIVSRTDGEDRLNFEAVEYKDAKGESNPCYLLTRDGFTFTAMGFTGAKARRVPCGVLCGPAWAKRNAPYLDYGKVRFRAVWAVW
jgi:Rha family phage regulatory protein